MLQDIDVRKLKDMSFDELEELVQRENIDIGNASTKTGIITKIHMALREAGIDPSKIIEEEAIEQKKKKETKKTANKNDMSAVKRDMLTRCKHAKKVKIRCDSIYAPIFGQTYTFLLNCVPVTIRFDGTEQEFPEPIAKRIIEKLREVSNSNAPKPETYEELA